MEQRRSPAELAARYRDVRQQTEALCATLTAEDAAGQSMPDASPAKWHLAHTTWFFETFVLERALPSFRPFHPSYRVLFNSYYNAVGEQYARPQRGLLTRPGLDEVRRYRAAVDEQLLALCEGAGGGAPRLTEQAASVVELGLHHEQQHQELLLTDVKHLFSCNPLWPTFRACESAPGGEVSPLGWQEREAGLHEVGHDGRGFAFDNEGPRHRVYLEAHALATRLVTCGEYLGFLADGGYLRPELWLSDGWATVQREGWEAPLYWERRDADGARPHPDGEWWQLTLGGPRRVRPEEPVCHVSYYEADAFARWAGARLPTEEEWEVAAEECADGRARGNFVERGWLHPAPVAPAGGGAGPGAAPQQLFGDVWEWTRSAYAPYPGYAPPPGAVGEYNGKFMCNQMVLRGGSCATPRSHIRASYRNFFYPASRWQFSGIRLARGAGPRG